MSTPIWISRTFCAHPPVLFFYARMTSLKRVDTRFFQIVSSLFLVGWLLFFVFDGYVPLAGTQAKIIAYGPHSTWFGLTIPIIIFQFVGALGNIIWMRRMGDVLAVFWWGWLAVLSYIEPPYFTPGFWYTVLSLASAWSFLTMRYENEQEGHA